MNIRPTATAALLLFASSSLAGNTSDLIFSDDFEEASGSTFSVGGNISLGSNQFSALCCAFVNSDFCLLLQNNGGDDLEFADSESGPWPFQFSEAVTDGQPYNVTVARAPLVNPTNSSCTSGTQLSCSVDNGSGVIGGADVDNVQVTCN